MKKLLLFISIFLSISSPTFAHKPRFALFDNPDINIPTQIYTPDVSQVFYGELNGTPEYYKFSLDQETASLIGILVPIAEKNFTSVELIDENNMSIGILKETDYKDVYFEEFGGDFYIKGPELKTIFPPGDYTLKIYNKTNLGKYALVIGEKESFPLLESLKTIVILPAIKELFFGKPILEIFGTFLGIFILLMSLLYRRSGKNYKNKFVVGTIILLLSTLAIIARNPLLILGMVRTLLILITLILQGIGIFKIKLGRKMYRTILFFWILVLFLTATI